MFGISSRVVLFAALIGSAAPARAADPWDQASEDDDGPTTDNALAHGTEQAHDLHAKGGVADEDWYVLVAEGHSSYEVIVDNATGDLKLTAADLTRFAADGDLVLQDATPLVGGSVVLRWQNTGKNSVTNYIRVGGAACGTACTSDDQYRIRMYDTTYAYPRWDAEHFAFTLFETVNKGPSACAVSYNVYDCEGKYLGSVARSLAPHATDSLQTVSVGGFPQQPPGACEFGSILVAQTCGQGRLQGLGRIIQYQNGVKMETPFALTPRIP